MRSIGPSPGMVKESIARDFVRRLAPALRQAASIARALEGRVANQPKSDEDSPVKAALTIADTAAQEALLVPLHEHFPDVALAAEEDTLTARLFRGRGDPCVVIDPIDGTLRFYLEGLGPYAVMIGLALGGEYLACLVALPREGLFFSAVRGGGASSARGEGVPRRAQLDATGERIYVTHDLPAEAWEFLRSKGLEPIPSSGGAISVAPLVPGVRAGLRLVRSTPSVSIRGRIGAMIAEEAGALVHCETGGPFPRDIDAPACALLVAATAADMTLLEETYAVAMCAIAR